jgi:hypothetical protein
MKAIPHLRDLARRVVRGFPYLRDLEQIVAQDVGRVAMAGYPKLDILCKGRLYERDMSKERKVGKELRQECSHS